LMYNYNSQIVKVVGQVANVKGIVITLKGTMHPTKQQPKHSVNLFL